MNILPKNLELFLCNIRSIFNQQNIVSSSNCKYVIHSPVEKDA